MNLKQKFFIIFSLLSFGLIPYSHASTIYTPAATILMTGSTEDIRFDVAGAIFDAGTTAESPKLDTATRNFRGAFYMTGIGWGLFQTGTYQVTLDCGGVSLSLLTSPCRLTGSGWAESIGELGFSGAEYLPQSGTLSGSVRTLVGEKSLSGVFLSLKPAYLTTSIDGISATHDINLAISGATGYAENGGGWSITLEPQKALDPRIIAGSLTGAFFHTDFSLADTYQMTITDQNGSTTVSTIHILPGILSLSHRSGTYYLVNFCNSHPSICPDGNTLKPTELRKIGDNLIGDGISYYHFYLQSRDEYGNMINTGSVSIEYTTSIKTVQLDDDENTLPPVSFMGSSPGSAVIHSGGVLINRFDGTSGASHIDMLGQDIHYGIASIAPSNSENVVKLESILYTTGTGQIVPITGIDMTPLVFRPWFEASTTTAIPEIQVGEDHGFQVSVTDNGTRMDTTPDIFTFLTVGSGSFGAFRDFTTTIPIGCQAYPQDLPSYSGICDWNLIDDFITPSLTSVGTRNSFVLTGTYAPMTRYPIKEDVRSENMIHYAGIGAYSTLADILYRTNKTSYGTSAYRDSRVKILGVTNAQGEYGDISLGGNGKTKFFDTLRKQIMLLSRNRTTFDDVDYLIVTGDYTLTGGSFDTKRSIIVVGGNANISANIDPKSMPVAVIAVADRLGVGGIINIDPTVTDIDASLISDRHIISSGDKQLYIHGSLISSNTLGDTAARICPYYVSIPCDTLEASNYDLEKIREAFASLSDTTGKTSSSPRAVGYPNTALIIEQDVRVLSTPPPGL